MFGKWSAQLSLKLQKSVQAFDGTTSKVHVFSIATAGKSK
jgi:hypothetical protein